MNPFVITDEFLINCCQKLSDRLTRLTGVGGINYKIAYIALTLYVAFDIFAHFIRGISLSGLIGVCFTVWIGIMYKRMYDRKENSEDGQTGVRAVDGFSRIWLWRFFRLLFLVFFGMNFWYLNMPPPADVTYDYNVYCLALMAADLSFAVSLYFFACHKLPPCKGTAKEWLASFGRKLVPAKNES
ncbi:TPA: hypothetical protein DF272_06755 [Candidatus Falkowbacteria bacterium]|nr:hypothetical protein [Candidatus Falkowbacteria bacterium]